MCRSSSYLPPRAPQLEVPSFWNMNSCGRPATASLYLEAVAVFRYDHAMSEGGCLPMRRVRDQLRQRG